MSRKVKFRSIYFTKYRLVALCYSNTTWSIRKFLNPDEADFKPWSPSTIGPVPVALRAVEIFPTILQVLHIEQLMVKFVSLIIYQVERLPGGRPRSNRCFFFRLKFVLPSLNCHSHWINLIWVLRDFKKRVETHQRWDINLAPVLQSVVRYLSF